MGPERLEDLRIYHAPAARRGGANHQPKTTTEIKAPATIPRKLREAFWVARNGAGCYRAGQGSWRVSFSTG